MQYALKNSGFVTSHKLKSFMRCGFCFKKEFIEMVPNPLSEDNDNFVIGIATEDLIVGGVKEFSKKYEVVSRRSKNEEVKIQLTNSMNKKILNCAKEFSQNDLFHRKYKQKVFILEMAGLQLKAELDNFDKKEKMIVDLKTCANIFTFEPMNYVHQMAFYQLIIEELTGVRCRARLEVVDKGTHFSRSRCYEFSEETLLADRGRILDGLEKYKLALENDAYFSSHDPETLEACPFYGLEGHGRRKKPIII